MTLLFDGNNTRPNAHDGMVGSNFGSLPNLGENMLTRPTWKRSLQELAASNIALIDGKRNNTNRSNESDSGRHHASTAVAFTSNAPPTTAAQMLLGSRTDFGSLLTSKRQSSFGTGTAVDSRVQFDRNSHNGAQRRTTGSCFSFDAMNGLGIEEVSRRHRDGMLERILKDQRKETQRLLDKAAERQIEDDWKEERAWWRKELIGDRNLVDATSKTTTLCTIDRSFGGPGLGDVSNFSSLRGRGLLSNARSPTSFATRCDPKAMRGHLDIVKSLKPTSDPKRVIADFDSLARDNSDNGYHNAWLLLGCMLPNMQNPINGAHGALSHFCRQYQSIIKNHVTSANLVGQDVSTIVNYGESTMAGTIAAYVKLTSGSNASVWEILYFCLRCGDAKAAKAVLDVTPAGGREEFLEPPVINRVINLLSQRQGNVYCMFEAGTPMIASEDRLAIFNIYEKTKNLEPNNTHKLGVLALLCGQQLESFSTVEDYLFGCLWLAVVDKEDPVGQIKVVGDSVRKYGPSHFVADGSGEWGYVLPLLASQQFETALSYLAEAGGPTGLLQAVHLGIVFELAGVDITDLNNALTPSVLSSKNVVTALLVEFSSLSERAIDSLQYVLKIPFHEDRKKQIANLIYRSPADQMETLVGVLDAVGNRKCAILDEVLPENDVNTILVAAAELFKTQSSDLTASAKLYMLGYRHSKIIELLNENISPVHIFNDQTMYWKNQSDLFYQSYLSKRSTVIDSIEREGKLKLINTNRILIELRSFFDKYREKQFSDAFDILRNTGLLPSTQEKLNEMTSKYRDLDRVLKDQFPTVLSAGVECSCEIFLNLKSKSHGMSSAVDQRLRELQFSARILFIFAGLTNMPSTCKNDIVRMRANMII